MLHLPDQFKVAVKSMRNAGLKFKCLASQEAGRILKASLYPLTATWYGIIAAGSVCRILFKAISKSG